MLTPRWREGQELDANGSMELDITDTDPNTFLIILNIIHCRMARVPHVVDFDTLTELAVLADYFQCHEALEPYPSIWLRHLKNSVPSMYCRDLVKWIFISWVFNYDDIFTKVTRIVQLHADHDISLYNLPIPESIYSTINKTRRVALSTILAALKRRREYLENNDQPACCADCDSLYLGTLIKSMKSNDLNPESSYFYFSVDTVARRISNFRQPPNIHASKPGSVTFSTAFQSNLKLLGESTKHEIEMATSALQGLDLS
ncbi:uncharacterized protein EURHEDRAFT_417062 [Aspergillus ruber CBS 135680]|uniref:BTB domain-containing protein n=1 Tax=Aspergillus ruber (strain CBS 135680) TaxID=1388766 RepID=A0A017S133_ASPRC|nr:uncharacterized protein EURHEDRAFT_417062 [Aspergillus ruber CBS 135680]EYE90758.1 hypothetical protein EURHEDRAFT_417062 [Aspergillus ruber CBS 135680]